MTNLYELVANAKTQGTSDGDYFLSNQQGAMVVEKLIEKTTGLRKTVILAGTILEAHPKKAGGQAQTPGTKVKKIYSLSKYDWAIDELKTDIVKMSGIDEKSLSPNDVASMFKEVFVNDALKGVVVTFNSRDVVREGKPTLCKVDFGEPPGDNTDPKHVNHPDNIAARAANIK